MGCITVGYHIHYILMMILECIGKILNARVTWQVSIECESKMQIVRACLLATSVCIHNIKASK